MLTILIILYILKWDRLQNVQFLKKLSSSHIMQTRAYNRWGLKLLMQLCSGSRVTTGCKLFWRGGFFRLLTTVWWRWERVWCVGESTFQSIGDTQGKFWRWLEEGSEEGPERYQRDVCRGQVVDFVVCHWKCFLCFQLIHLFFLPVPLLTTHCPKLRMDLRDVSVSEQSILGIWLRACKNI